MADLSRGQGNYEGNNGAGGVVMVARKPIARKIPASIFHQVQMRDRGRCAYKSPEGKICENPRSLEVHHLRPWAIGGGHEISNLQTLCGAHHGLKHKY
jgi:5-methylcytosine-specific restriction endonuclease McrA